MTSRAIVPLLLLSAPLLAGVAPEPDPVVAAFRGLSGPEAVAAPVFDAEAEACSWTTRPRREIVDGLAARLLRGETPSWRSRAESWPAPLEVPSRFPQDFDPAGVPVTDRLASWVPADAAVVFFASLADEETKVGELDGFLPRAFPSLAGDGYPGRRDALRRAAESLCLPTIWGANPGVRTGTRQVAVVVSDLDLRWGADVAFLAEVDDASLVRSQRQASLRWEERRARVIRTEGLDAIADDGSVRSFFALEGGVAVWATTRSLRDRILAAGADRAPSVVRPDPRAYALARRTFPASEGGALLVVPDGFVARMAAPELRARRATALRCEATRLVLDARMLVEGATAPAALGGLACPAGGRLLAVAGSAGSCCSLHGTALSPAPLGDMAPGEPLPIPGAAASPPIPVAARWLGRPMDVLVPPGETGAAFLRLLGGEFGSPEGVGWKGLRARLRCLGARPGAPPPATCILSIRRLTGMDLEGAGSHTYGSPGPVPPARPAGGILRVGASWSIIGTSGGDFESVERTIEWR